jgi:hypothetical protein
MADTEHSNADEFEAWIEAEQEKEGDPRIELNRGVKNWTVPIGEGGDDFAYMTLDTADGFMSVRSGEAAYQFEMSLGPVNAKKLIAFLRTLPPEPDDDEKPEEV